MPTPVRACRWCGSDQFLDSGRIEWEVRSAQGDGYLGRKVEGTMLCCARCGLAEFFLEHPLDLLALPQARELGLRGAQGLVSKGEASPGEGANLPAWQVVLLHAGPTPIGVIAELRKELTLDLGAARAAVQRLPWVLTRTSRREAAEALGEKLGALGAVVRVEPAGV